MKMSQKFSRRVENTVRKEEISPFPSVFERFVLQTRKNQLLFGGGLMQGQTCRCATDSGPRHTPAGLRPAELKRKMFLHVL